MTVTGTTRFSASQTWVMPSLRPRIPLPAIAVFVPVLVGASCAHANAPPAWPGGRRRRSVISVVPRGSDWPARTSVGELGRSLIRPPGGGTAGEPVEPTGRPGQGANAGRSGLLDLDFDVDPGRQVESLQRFDGLAGGLDDVEETLVDPHLEVLAGVLVDVRGPHDAEAADLGREGHRAPDLGLGADHGLDDLL